MPKELEPEQIKEATKISKRFEKFWRSAFRPKDFTTQEQEDLSIFFNTQVKKFKSSIEVGGDFLDKGLITKVFLGLFHYPDVKIPNEGDKSRNN